MKQLLEIYESVLDDFDTFSKNADENVLKDTIKNATSLPPFSSSLNMLAREFDKIAGTDYESAFNNWKTGDVKKMFSIVYNRLGIPYALFYSTNKTLYQVSWFYRMGSKTHGYITFSKPKYMRIDTYIDIVNGISYDPNIKDETMLKHWEMPKQYKWLSDWIVQTWRENKY